MMITDLARIYAEIEDNDKAIRKKLDEKKITTEYLQDELYSNHNRAFVSDYWSHGIYRQLLYSGNYELKQLCKSLMNSSSSKEISPESYNYIIACTYSYKKCVNMLFNLMNFWINGSDSKPIAEQVMLSDGVNTQDRIIADNIGICGNIETWEKFYQLHSEIFDLSKIQPFVVGDNDIDEHKLIFQGRTDFNEPHYYTLVRKYNPEEVFEILNDFRSEFFHAFKGVTNCISEGLEKISEPGE